MTEKTTENDEILAKHKAAINEADNRLVPVPYCNMTSWFAIVLAQIRTRWILREKADSKQSNNHSTSLPEKG